MPLTVPCRINGTASAAICNERDLEYPPVYVTQKDACCVSSLHHHMAHTKASSYNGLI